MRAQATSCPSSVAAPPFGGRRHDHGPKRAAATSWRWDRMVPSTGTRLATRRCHRWSGWSAWMPSPPHTWWAVAVTRRQASEQWARPGYRHRDLTPVDGSRRVEDGVPGSDHIHEGIGQPVLDSLEGPDRRSELDALGGPGCGMVQGRRGRSDHMRSRDDTGNMHDVGQPGRVRSGRADHPVTIDEHRIEHVVTLTISAEGGHRVERGPQVPMSTAISVVPSRCSPDSVAATTKSSAASAAPRADEIPRPMPPLPPGAEVEGGHLCSSTGGRRPEVPGRLVASVFSRFPQDRPYQPPIPVRRRRNRCGQCDGSTPSRDRGAMGRA